MSEPRRARRMGHGPGGGMVPGEKAKNFKSAAAKLIRYMGNYKIAVLVVMIFAVASTVFGIAGPKILGQATTELFNGLVAKVSGTGGIAFGKIGKILLFLVGIYAFSAACSFVQGWIMTGITQKICFRFREDISEKINRMPMKYFESRTVGEVLSRITNDVD
ncbi:MAG: ABC transporter ATP-binding protein, partial [Lachnospiraceae bacterium]|nr:ABC transporter ATP-binding protein [Lachnospiraceae bacterium]